MARLENGNTLVLLEKQAENPTVNAQLFRDEYFAEITPDGEVIWEWYTSEHLDEMGFSDEARQLMYVQKGPIWHTNTLSVLPGNELEQTDTRFAKGNILTSQRETSLIYIIDRNSGKVVWTWGLGEGQLVGQHHPVMLHNGNILIYDNGGESGYPLKVRFYTRLVELDPVSGEIVWEYAHQPYTFKPLARFFSSTWGSVQRLPNGNTLSLDCHNGRVFEVTPSGEIVWEYVSPFSWGRGTQVVESGMFRVYRYGYDEVPEPDPVFKNTDGHMDCPPVQVSLLEGMGLPSLDLP
jgi:outer membrane protein assembly factor BamB